MAEIDIFSFSNPLLGQESLEIEASNFLMDSVKRCMKTSIQCLETPIAVTHVIDTMSIRDLEVINRDIKPTSKSLVSIKDNVLSHLQDMDRPVFPLDEPTSCSDQAVAFMNNEHVVFMSESTMSNSLKRVIDDINGAAGCRGDLISSNNSLMRRKDLDLSDVEAKFPSDMDLPVFPLLSASPDYANVSSDLLRRLHSMTAINTDEDITNEIFQCVTTLLDYEKQIYSTSQGSGGKLNMFFLFPLDHEELVVDDPTMAQHHLEELDQPCFPLLISGVTKGNLAQEIFDLRTFLVNGEAAADAMESRSMDILSSGYSEFILNVIRPPRDESLYLLPQTTFPDVVENEIPPSISAFVSLVTASTLPHDYSNVSESTSLCMQDYLQLLPSFEEMISRDYSDLMSPPDVMSRNQLSSLLTGCASTLVESTSTHSVTEKECTNVIQTLKPDLSPIQLTNFVSQAAKATHPPATKAIDFISSLQDDDDDDLLNSYITIHGRGGAENVNTKVAEYSVPERAPHPTLKELNLEADHNISVHDDITSNSHQRESAHGGASHLYPAAVTKATSFVIPQEIFSESAAHKLLPQYQYGNTDVKALFLEVQELFLTNQKYSDAVSKYLMLNILDSLIEFERNGDYVSVIPIITQFLVEENICALLNPVLINQLEELRERMEVNDMSMGNINELGNQKSTGGEYDGRHKRTLDYGEDIDTSEELLVSSNKRRRLNHDDNTTLFSSNHPPSSSWSHITSLRIICSEELLQNVGIIHALRVGYNIVAVTKSLIKPLSLLIDENTGVVIVDAGALLTSDLSQVKGFSMSISNVSVSLSNIWVILDCDLGRLDPYLFESDTVRSNLLKLQVSLLLLSTNSPDTSIKLKFIFSPDHLVNTIAEICEIAAATEISVYRTLENYVTRDWLCEEDTSLKEAFLCDLCPSLNLYSCIIIETVVGVKSFLFMSLDEMVAALFWISPRRLELAHRMINYDHSISRVATQKVLTLDRPTNSSGNQMTLKWQSIY